MSDEHTTEVSSEILERLAAIEHERWSHWQRYLHGKGELQPDGSLVLPAELIKRWERQMATEYAGLDAAEQDSDREQVLRYLPEIIGLLGSGVIGHSQKMTVSAVATAEKKTVGQQS